MNAAEQYAAQLDAVHRQRSQVLAEKPWTGEDTASQGDFWGRELSRRFRQDPLRELDPHLALIASFVEPDDVLLDVGGGGGRVGLPLARRCKQVINVDPSPAMQEQFQAAAAEAGIKNIRSVEASWLDAQDVVGDVSLAVNVTYFMRDIVSFIKKLEATSRRRIMISVWSISPRCQDQRLFRRVFGQEQECEPSYQELLKVLWEMNVLPEVRVTTGSRGGRGSNPQRTREEAVQAALQAPWINASKSEQARRVIEEHFDELFAETPEGFRPLWLLDPKEILITWEKRS